MADLLRFQFFRLPCIHKDISIHYLWMNGAAAGVKKLLKFYFEPQKIRNFTSLKIIEK